MAAERPRQVHAALRGPALHLPLVLGSKPCPFRVAVERREAPAVVFGVMIPRMMVDTDSENMLPADQPDRVEHNRIRALFDLHDMIVVGIVNDRHEHGIYNPESIEALLELTRAIERIEGVIARDLMALRLTYRMMRDNLILDMMSFYSPSDEDWFLRPTVEYRHTDRLQVNGGANVFGGRGESTFYGQFEEDGSVFLRLRYSF